eukprot:scaffold541_cov138-Cylindrotheca_fusiformis.AAC.12
MLIWILGFFVASGPHTSKKHRGNVTGTRIHNSSFSSASSRRETRKEKRTASTSETPRPRPQPYSTNSDYWTPTSGSLEEALECFDVSCLGSLNQESLRKKFLALCLQHHPDRNGNSSESIKRMQLINDSYDLLCQEVRNLRQSRASTSSRQTSPSTPPMGMSRQQSRRLSPEQLREGELAEIYQLEKEWKARQKRGLRARRKLDSFYERAGLHTEKGRQRSYSQWVQDVKEYQRASHNRGYDGSLPSSKPRNLVMDYCSHPIAMALRSGDSDLAITALTDKLKRCKAKWRKYKFASLEFPLNESDSSLCDLVLRETLLRSLDADGNHVLHYAVYYDQKETVDFLLHTAQYYGRFEAFLAAENNWGDTAEDFLVVSQDASLCEELRHFCNEAALNEDHQCQSAASSIFKKLHFQNQKISLKPAFCTIGGMLVGTHIFGCRWFSSLGIVVASRKSSFSKDKRTFSEYLWIDRHILEAHVLWFLVKKSYEFTVLLVPCWVLILPLLYLLIGEILPMPFSDWLLQNAALPSFNAYCAMISWISYYAIPFEVRSRYHWKEVAVLLAIKAVATKVL